MAPLPATPPSPTLLAILKAYEAEQGDGFRAHLGASLIGKSCERALWFDFRWVTKAFFEGRMLRLFETGQLEEARLVRNLRATGATVLDLDPDTGRQFRVSAVDGHFGGSLDAIAIGILEAEKTWHVVEFKTHSAKSFSELQAKGVQRAKPQHYAQMQIYMHLIGMTRAIYLAVAKDTDALYVERIAADRDEAERLLAKAKRIISAPRPLAKISEDASFFECRMCSHRNVCHTGNLAAVNCRTCLHSTPIENGWHCARHDQALDFDAQRRACPNHLYVPDLVKGTITSVEQDRIVYRLDDGTIFTDGEKEHSSC